MANNGKNTRFLFNLVISSIFYKNNSKIKKR